ncbi:proteasome subunit beta [Candidatus Woesearchaeota archaeon]|jgi:proteasome beta subunit|nr:proteasome subunit beta [Candidatus Woesearchaeota archaeon]
MDSTNTRKTGTTTIGMKFKDGILLAADKRATAGNLIANKEIQKVFPINDNLALTTAGSVSDVQLQMKLLKAELNLKQIRCSREVTVKEGANLLAGMVYENIRKFSSMQGISHFLFAGKDETGFHLYDIYPDGSISEADDYISSGSGSVFSLGVLEALYKPNLSMEDAKSLAIKCLNASLQRDSASGNGFDMLTITSKGISALQTKILNNKL